MAKLYYGSGNCSIEGANIRGVQLKYSGNIRLQKTANDHFAIAHHNNGVMVFPVDVDSAQDDYLNDLFKYSGNFKVLSVLVAGDNGEKVPCTIKSVTDFADQLNTKAEDLTTFSNDLRAGYSNNNQIEEYDGIIKNLHSKGQLYLEDGSLYSGMYHIHMKDGHSMTGGEHTKKSEGLYIKQVIGGIVIDRLVSTKNPTRVPLVNRLRGRHIKRIKKR